MVKFIKTYWFGFLVGLFMVLFTLFIGVVALAPHDDAKMRGFAPCTHQLALDLGQMEEVKFFDVVKEVNNVYGCYFDVMKEGLVLYLRNEQSTPWANYWFEPEVYAPKSGEGEAMDPYPQDLLDASLLNDDHVDEVLMKDINEENKDGEESAEE